MTSRVIKICFVIKPDSVWLSNPHLPRDGDELNQKNQFSTRKRDSPLWRLEGIKGSIFQWRFGKKANQCRKQYLNLSVAHGALWSDYTMHGCLRPQFNRTTFNSRNYLIKIQFCSCMRGALRYWRNQVDMEQAISKQSMAPLCEPIYTLRAMMEPNRWQTLSLLFSLF